MVYFVRAVGTAYVKIGYTSDLSRRMNGLLSGCPFDLEVELELEGGYELEGALHEWFKDYRLRREWFEMESYELPSEDELVRCMMEREGRLSSVRNLSKEQRAALREEREKLLDLSKSEVMIRFSGDNHFNYVVKGVVGKLKEPEFISQMNLGRWIGRAQSTIGYNMNDELQEWIDNYNMEHFGTTVFSNYIKRTNIERIRVAVESIKSCGKRVTKIEVHRRTGLSYNTVSNLWGEVDK